MNDDIEILDIFDKKEEKRTVPIKKENIIKEDVPKKKVKKRKLKTKAVQKVFCLVSAIFILGCIAFYGYRFIKYYRIYNPKVSSSDGVMLGKYITGSSEIVYNGSGLYSSSGSYIFKGDVSDNYVKYNNMLWRILSIDPEKNIELILDDYISLLPWNNETSTFDKSEIYNYLNKDFLNNLDKDMLAKTNYCKDKVDDISAKLNSKCGEYDFDTYVKLLDVTDFLNSVKDSKTFLASKDEIFWLSDYGNDKAWHTNGTNVSQSNVNTFYEVRPVIKLKNTINYTKGDGKRDTPYEVGEDNKVMLGSIVTLGEDKWIVYDISSNVKLMKYDVLDKKQIFDKNNLSYDESSLKEYLNTTYLDSLSYKDKIIENDYYIGGYTNKLNDIKDKKVKVKVGIPNILDIKFNSSINGYYTSTNYEEVVWVYENPLRPSRNTSERSIRPCITISKSEINKLVYSDGVFKEAK